MKIYASTGSVLDRYIGQDVWIKCLQDGSTECRYLRPLYRKGEYLYVNTAYEHVLKYKDIEDIRNEIASVVFIDPTEYQIVNPLTVLRTEDLFPKDVAHAYDGSLDKYIGTDIWVKVFSYMYDYECYINIISIKNGVISYHVMDANLIDNHSPSDPYGFDEIPTVDDLKWEDFCAVDAVKLVTPVDVLTTDELVEELEACTQELEDL